MGLATPVQQFSPFKNFKGFIYVDQTLGQVLEEARTTGHLFISGEQDWGPDLSYIKPRQIGELRSINIADCGITEFPMWILDSETLEELQLPSNQIKSVPAAISSLRTLRVLNLSGNQISVLPEDIGQLTSLTYLGLSSTRISELPESFGELAALEELDLGSIPSLSQLPPSFQNLQSLKRLFLWGTSLTQIPRELRLLRRLEFIELSRQGSYNRDSKHDDSTRDRWPEYGATVGVSSARGAGEIAEIPSWMADSLPNLEYLYLGGHRISDLPPNFSKLRALRGLFLGDNQLPSIPQPILHLAALQELDLRNNKITAVPRELRRLNKLGYLDLKGNPFSIPPEVLAQTNRPTAILEYLQHVDTAETRPLNEAKLIFVGEGAVGKTSLLQRLVLDSFDAHQAKTEGIDIAKWDVNVGETTITLNTWDFGGQEIMHATHQFFLTKRSVYVLVIDSRQDEDQNRIEYWLKLIQSFSGHSPVIIAANKSDQHVPDLDQRGLRSKYTNITSIVATSCLTSAGIADLREEISRTVRQLAHVGDPIPQSYFKIKEYLEGLDVDYLSIGEYEKLCRDNGVLDTPSQELLISFLHDLGTVLCFRDDPRLASTNILNPAWVTGGVYRLLNSNLAAQRKGLLTWADINSILDSSSYPSEQRPVIVDMMKRFELCYESEGIFLIPDLLTKDELDTGDWAHSLRFEIKYDILPPSIMCRLIVRMHDTISKHTVWRTGMVLTMDRNRALVKADREDSLVTINVSGPQPGRRGLLTAIRTELKAIQRTIPGLTAEERVPVPEHSGIFVPYQHLIDLEEAGRETVIPQGTVDDFSISELLAGVESPADRASITNLARPANSTTFHTVEAMQDSSGAWTISQSIGLGIFLLVGIVVILGASIGAYEVMGATAAVILGLALSGVAVIGLFVLRSGGRISEAGFVASVRDAISNVGSNDKAGNGQG